VRKFVQDFLLLWEARHEAPWLYPYFFGVFLIVAGTLGFVIGVLRFISISRFI
jgi:hypothetical protein